MNRVRGGTILAAASVVGVLLAATLVQQAVPGTPMPVAVPVPSSATSATVDTPKLAPVQPSCDDVASPLTTRQRLAQLVMVGVPAGSLENARKLAKDDQVGGIFVHANPTVLLTDGRLAQVRAAARIPLTVSIDEEGGRVQTVDGLAGDMPSARRMATTMTPDEVKAQATARAKFLTKAGVTMDFAPVLDVAGKSGNSVIGDRSFGSDPKIVKRYASAFAIGLASGGVVPVLKHFPGHGNVAGDSHKQTAVTPPLARLKAVDLVPYQGINDYGPAGVMIGHLVVPDLTGNEPATLSPATYQLLREQFQFKGVAVTDDLGAMRAVTDRYDLPQAVLLAIKAGADMALWSSGARIGEVLDRLEAASQSGELPAGRIRDALRHVFVSKGICAS